jgi:hypothetical protein
LKSLGQRIRIAACGARLSHAFLTVSYGWTPVLLPKYSVLVFIANTVMGKV